MRGRWIWDREAHELVPAHEYYARKAPQAVSDLPRPMVISDHMDTVKSMVDGQMYDSKSALRRTYREGGYIEVGNEELKPFRRPEPDAKAIRDSVSRAMTQAGYQVDG